MGEIKYMPPWIQDISYQKTNMERKFFLYTFKPVSRFYWPWQGQGVLNASCPETFLIPTTTASWQVVFSFHVSAHFTRNMPME